MSLIPCQSPLGGVYVCVSICIACMEHQYLYVYACMCIFCMTRVYFMYVSAYVCMYNICMYCMYCVYCMYMYVSVCTECIACILLHCMFCMYLYVFLCTVVSVCIACIVCMCMFEYVLALPYFHIHTHTCNTCTVMDIQLILGNTYALHVCVHMLTSNTYTIRCHFQYIHTCTGRFIDVSPLFWGKLAS